MGRVRARVWVCAALTAGSVHTALATSQQPTPLEASRSGPIPSRVTLARDVVEITASQDASNVSIQVSRGETGGEKQKNDNFPQGTEKPSNYRAWSLILKAPVKKGEDDTELANLDGLANAFTATLKFNRLRLVRRNPTDAALDQLCDQDASDLKPGKKPPCDAGLIKEALGQVGYNQWHDLFFAPRQYAWGWSATVGTQSFDFLPDASLDKATEHKTPWSAEVFAAVEQFRAGLFTLSLRYEGAYKASDTGTRCPGNTTTAVIDCVTKPLGAPKKTESEIVSLEFRRATTLSDLPVAVSPSAQYDFRENVFGIELPVYLWTNDKGRFTGGIKAGWRDDEGGVTVGLFVGTPFSLSPSP